nr:YolD-like family protein [Staphylococcus gallinarum]
MKWAAFKTLPEQYERLEQYIEDQNKIDKPELSDHQLNDLNDTLIFKMYHEPEIIVSYFDNGYINKKEGYIHKVDPYTQTLYLYEETGLITMKLSEITEIK